jgi:hypothetical protein
VTGRTAFLFLISNNIFENFFVVQKRIYFRLNHFGFVNLTTHYKNENCIDNPKRSIHYSEKMSIPEKCKLLLDMIFIIMVTNIILKYLFMSERRTKSPSFFYNILFVLNQNSLKIPVLMYDSCFIIVMNKIIQFLNICVTKICNRMFENVN